MSEIVKAHPRTDVIDLAQAVAQVATKHAVEVDVQARFPKEAIAAAQQAGLLSAGYSTTQMICNVALQAAVCSELARSCASTAMVLAMHYIQLDCIANHCEGNGELSDYLTQVSKEQRLLASVTSEVGVDGDLRRSVAAIERAGSSFKLSKQATTVSYGKYADDFLVTARACESAAESDQRLVLALGAGTTLQTTGSWDTLGMRGTVSPGGNLTVRGKSWQLLEVPFAQIAGISMVPISHLLWSACWLGIARSALDRARSAVQKKGRKAPNENRGAADRLASIYSRYAQLQTQHQADLAHYDTLLRSSNQQTLLNVKEVIRFNNLKIETSEGVAHIVTQAIQATGVAAFRNDSEYSLGRHLRDALSAPLMINNDRIRAANADMQLIFKDR